MHTGMLLLFLLYVCGFTEAAPAPDRLQYATTTYSLDLFKELTKGEPKNLIVSPMSVSAVLAMLMQGARGSTAKQLETSLHLDSSQAMEVYGELSKHYQKDRSATNTTLQFANHLFLNHNFQLRPEFQRALVESFQSGIDLVTFGTGEGARAVNEWASRATRGKIPKLVGDELPASTALVMTNAIFFKSPWEEPFEKKSTYDRDFTVKPGHTVKVPFMAGERFVPFAEFSELNAKVVVLPFKGKQFSLLLVLPKEESGLEELISKLTTSHISKMISTDSSVLIDIRIPLFKLESTHQLNTPLSQLGLAELFGNPDLSGISEEPLVVSQALQKATIEIDEEGGVAAAVTALIADIESIEVPIPKPLVVFDRPFLAMIVDHEKKVPLFMTAVVDPSSGN